MYGPKLKYVRTSDDVIIIFPEYITHHKFLMFRPVSAGFIQIQPVIKQVTCKITGKTDGELCLKFFCFGESESLKLKSSPKEDTELAQRQFGQGG